jgi:hypothetical protein
MENVVNRKDPRQIRIMVLNPALLLWYSLSAPINPPTTITIKSWSNNMSIEGMLYDISFQIYITQVGTWYY